MIGAFFPLKKLRRNGKYLLFGAILLVGVVAVYHEMVAARALESDVSYNFDSSSWRTFLFNEKSRRAYHPDPMKNSTTWTGKINPQTWKPEYKGQANLHVFEDWCGSSTADLRRNLHYPLYPHIRTTVSKLAISPQWNNYGLRVFGYIHPYENGDFVFALSSDDNSELWLSTDESPLNLHLLAWVGNTGSEWTAPGEFEKYASQSSRPVRLSAQRRYFFEVVHKQNDQGTDHVEVAWQLLAKDFGFMVLESDHISLYTDESSLLMSDVSHIPQTAASHQQTTSQHNRASADMLREDPRDSFYQVPLINSRLLKGVLPDCSYKPSYTIKDLPLIRYQGLQFVHLSKVYPNDYTRLTHMENENSCFYPENPSYMKRFGFSRYMQLDNQDPRESKLAGRESYQRKRHFFNHEDDFDNDAYGDEKDTKRDEIGKMIKNAAHLDYGDDFDDYALRRRRRLFSLAVKANVDKKSNSSDRRLPIEKFRNKQIDHMLKQRRNQSREAVKQEVPLTGLEQINAPGKSKRKRITSGLKKWEVAPTQFADKEQQKVKGLNESDERLASKQDNLRSRKVNHTQIQRLKDSRLHHNKIRGVPTLGKPTESSVRRFRGREKTLTPSFTKHFSTPRKGAHAVGKLQQKDTDTIDNLRDKEIKLNMPLQQNNEKNNSKYNVIFKRIRGRRWSDTEKEDNQMEGDMHQQAEEDGDVGEAEYESPWRLFDGTEEDTLTPALEFDTPINWNQTFYINPMDMQAARSDWIDLNCNVSGNLLLRSSDALLIVKTFMDQLNQKHLGRFTLLRVVNVVKRVDGFQGNRYFLELELKDASGNVLRLAHYVYALLRSSQWSPEFSFEQSIPQFLLCNPVGFRWNPTATVHFIVPVKNQARWVHQLITDMEQLFRETGDKEFNLIITDYNSTDMDVQKALQQSSLHRYQYVKLSGNFERSAGLQAGIDLINNKHSIVFLCDLHISFPPSIIDTIRKHCVEGYMAFAPIVLRLNCGVTPLEAKGFWEVNGFGLLGIYKSDLLAAGGMNTKDFTDRWGGEDWELLDRLLQAGLEVERIYLRNFFHHYHSKRGMWNRQMSPRNR